MPHDSIGNELNPIFSKLIRKGALLGHPICASATRTGDDPGSAFCEKTTTIGQHHKYGLGTTAKSGGLSKVMIPFIDHGILRARKTSDSSNQSRLDLENLSDQKGSHSSHSRTNRRPNNRHVNLRAKCAASNRSQLRLATSSGMLTRPSLQSSILIMISTNVASG